jgi:hypothetical protein
VSAYSLEVLVRSSAQLELPLRATSQGTNEVVLWLLAATPSDSAQIVDAIHQFDHGNVTSFFVSVIDGAPALRANDLLAIRAQNNFHLFAARLPSIPSLEELAAQIARSLDDWRQVKAQSLKATEFLCLRLFSSTRDERRIHADSSLARALTFLQSRDGVPPRLVSQMAGEIIGAMRGDASPALDGLMRRLKAHALFQVYQTHAARRDLIENACELYWEAAASFDAAGISTHARACQRSARLLEHLMMDESPEPVLPGLEPAANEIAFLHLSRPAFRAFRTLAIPMSIRMPLELRSDQPMTASKLCHIGKIPLPEETLVRALRDVDSANLVPRLDVIETRGSPLAKRVRVSIEREHFSLLGIADRMASEGERSFQVMVDGADWDVSLDTATARLGRPVEFDARARAHSASPLRVLITAGGQLGQFEVHA